MHSSSISTASLEAMLPIPAAVPLSLDSMCRDLRPLFLPAPGTTERLGTFCLELEKVFMELGIRVETAASASTPEGKIRAGTVVLAPGIFPDELLAINRVETLYNNIIVGIYDEPAPLSEGSGAQERLDAIVGRLARDMVHILIYVTARSWTVCTMNGGVAVFPTAMPEREDVLRTLVPKLTAQVVPPRPEEFDLLEGALDTRSAFFREAARDFRECGRIWRENPVLLTHTSTDGLPYRTPYYRRIVKRYLDRRSGMSYGFFARQLPLTTEAAVRLGKAGACPTDPVREGASLKVPVLAGGEVYLVKVPEVRVLTTRSGCRKTAVEPERDLLEIGMSGGRPYIKTPPAAGEGAAARPSFDTLTILSHALGNALVASLLRSTEPDAPFPRLLEESGASMTHWHGYPEERELPAGYLLHGERNPPVSCSTPQSAAYSLIGKIDALELCLAEKGEGARGASLYRGDVHVEPYHGTNIVGVLSLTETALALNPRKEESSLLLG